MGTKCEKIATPGELGGDPFFKKLAAAAKNGDPAVIETCDVTARYGESVYSNKDIEELFFLGEQYLAEPNTIKNALKFYDALPTRKELQTANQSSAKKSLPEQVKSQLDFFFRAVRAAHDLYKIPYVFEGDLATIAAFSGKMNELNSDPTTAPQALVLAKTIIEWTCGSPHFPEPFFNKVAQEIVADAMSAQLFGKDDPDQSYRLCLTAATPLAARREHLSYLYTSVQAAIKLLQQTPTPQQQPPALRVGDIYPPSPLLDPYIKKQPVTVLMAWAEWCGACKQALPAIRHIHAALQTIGSGVVAFHIPPDDPKRLEQVKRDEQVTWVDAEIPLDQAPILNPSNSVPSFIVVDNTGKILFSKEGFYPDIEADIMSTLAPFLLKKGQ